MSNKEMRFYVKEYIYMVTVGHQVTAGRRKNRISRVEVEMVKKYAQNN